MESSAGFSPARFFGLKPKLLFERIARRKWLEVIAAPGWACESRMDFASRVGAGEVYSLDFGLVSKELGPHCRADFFLRSILAWRQAPGHSGPGQPRRTDPYSTRGVDPSRPDSNRLLRVMSEVTPSSLPQKFKSDLRRKPGGEQKTRGESASLFACLRGTCLTYSRATKELQSLTAAKSEKCFSRRKPAWV